MTVEGQKPEVPKAADVPAVAPAAPAVAPAAPAVAPAAPAVAPDGPRQPDAVKPPETVGDPLNAIRIEMPVQAVEPADAAPAAPDAAPVAPGAAAAATPTATPTATPASAPATPPDKSGTLAGRLQEHLKKEKIESSGKSLADLGQRFSSAMKALVESFKRLIGGKLDPAAADEKIKEKPKSKPADDKKKADVKTAETQEADAKALETAKNLFTNQLQWLRTAVPTEVLLPPAPTSFDEVLTYLEGAKQYVIEKDTAKLPAASLTKGDMLFFELDAGRGVNQVAVVISTTPPMMKFMDFKAETKETPIPDTDLWPKLKACVRTGKAPVAAATSAGSVPKSDTEPVPPQSS